MIMTMTASSPSASSLSIAVVRRRSRPAQRAAPQRDSGSRFTPRTPPSSSTSSFATATAGRSLDLDAADFAARRGRRSRRRSTASRASRAAAASACRSPGARRGTTVVDGLRRKSRRTRRPIARTGRGDDGARLRSALVGVAAAGAEGHARLRADERRVGRAGGRVRDRCRASACCRDTPPTGR